MCVTVDAQGCSATVTYVKVVPSELLIRHWTNVRVGRTKPGNCLNCARLKCVIVVLNSCFSGMRKGKKQKWL